jgi:hypothetical protein
MRIRFERTGGFAGLQLSGEVDSEKLSAAQAKEFKRLVEGARLFDQSRTPGPAPQTPDQFQYDLTIEDDDRAHTIQTTDTGASDELRALIDWLTDAARKGRATKS